MRICLLVVGFLSVCSVASAQAPPEDDWPLGTLPRSELPTSRAFDYDVQNVQISTILGWLRRFNVEPPVPLSGQVSGWLWAQAPARGWWRLGDYRVEGEIVSPLVGIDLFAIRETRIRFGYRQGLWSVGRAAGQIESLTEGPESRRVLGQANVSAQLPMSTSETVKANGSMQGVSLIELLATFGLKTNVPSGMAQGDFQLETLLADLSQPLRWRANGSLSATDVTLGELPLADVTTKWQLAEARLSLSDTRATVVGQTVTFSGSVDLTNSFAWTVQLPDQTLRLSRELYSALQLPPSEVIPLGDVQLTATSSGTLRPWAAQYAFQLGATRLAWLQNNLSQLEVAAAVTSDGIRLDTFTTRVAGGLFNAQAEFPTELRAPLRLKLEFQDIDLEQLQTPMELPAAGIVSGTGSATVDTAQLSNLNALAFSLKGTGDNLSVSELVLGHADYGLSKAAGTQDIDTSLAMAGGLMNARLAFPTAPATALTMTLDYKDIDLAQLRVQGELPATGIVWGSGNATMDSTRLTNLASLAFSLQGKGAGLRVSDWGLGDVNYSLSKVASTQIIDSSIEVAGGVIKGQAVFPSPPATPLSFNLDYQRIDLAQLRGPMDTPLAIGIVSGTASATLDTTQFRNLDALAFDLQGSGAGVRSRDWGFGNLNYSVSKTGRQRQVSIALEDAGAGRRWGATGVLQPVAGGNWSYEVAGSANRLDLSWDELLELTGIEWKLPVPLQIVLATGKVSMRGDTGAGLRETEFDFENLTAIQTDRTNWAVGSLSGLTTQSKIVIDKGDFAIGPGKLTWSMAYNWDGNGEDRIQLDLAAFSLETLRGFGLNAIPLFAGPRSVAGAVDVAVDLQRPAGQRSVLAGWAGDLRVDVRDLAIRGQKVGDLRAEGQLTEHQWDTQLRGQIFNADLRGNLKIALEREPSWSVVGVQGELAWLGAEANQLIGLWQPRRQSVQWRGTTYVRAQIDWQAAGEQSGFVELTVPQLAHRGRHVAREVRLSAQLQNGQLRIARFDGSVGGGRVRVNGAYDIASRRTQGLVIDLTGISLEDVARLIDPQIAADVEGRADVRIHVDLTNGAHLHGALRLTDTVWSGFPISRAHSDFQLIASPNFSQVRFHAPRIRGEAFGGRLEGDVRARFASGRSIEVSARVDRGEVEQLSKWTGTSSVVGRGKFNADVTLTSPRFQTLRDLRGRVDLVFEDTDARTLPVADQLARFVPLFGLPSTEFERGRLTAFLSRGDLRIRSLALWGRQLTVLGTGNVGLVSGRLDLELVVRVGGGLSQQVASNYLSQLAATAVPPVELVLQINRLVANRSLFLHVGGTTAQPVTQPQTGRIIEQALLRSLLEQAAPIVPALTGSPQAFSAPRG